MIERLIRTHLKSFQPYRSARSEVLEAHTLLDANELSFGSPIAFDAVSLNRYPDPLQRRLRAKLGVLLGVDPEAIFAGVGSDEIIDLLIRLFCEPAGDAVLILEPTYGIYRVAAEVNNIDVCSAELNEVFQIDVAKTLSAVTPHTKMIFCCSPNNPTGNLLRRTDIRKLCEGFPGIVVVDQAYVEFADVCLGSSGSSEPNNLSGDALALENLVVLRTLSKAWGLAGIRLGYCIADPVIVSYLLRIKAPYNVNAVTAEIALRALENEAFLRRSTSAVRGERDRLASALGSLSIISRVFPSDSNFLLVEFSDVQRAYEALAAASISVRRRSEPRLQNCLRITVGTPEENDRVLRCLQECT